MSIGKRLSTRIRALIKARKTTAEKVAYESGISKSYLSAVLRCRKSPTIRILDRIAKTLEVDVKELF